MLKTYEEAFDALIFAEGIEEARGGQIYRCPEGFSVRLFNQPEREECDIVFELNPSMEAGETWKWQAMDSETGAAYRAYEAARRL